MSQPLIGITTYCNLSPQGYPRFSASEAYSSALQRAGAVPVFIPLGLSFGSVQELLERIDGVLFSGGGDISPDVYGHTPHPLVSDVDLDRDRIEIDLINLIIKSDLPFLGICRGIQLINVAFKGTLYEDISEQHPGSIAHRFVEGYAREYLAHSIQVESTSRLAEILGGVNFQVNSLHHQGVSHLAPNLQPSATAPDGLIEAFELSDFPFGLAVRWHPENLQHHPPMQMLFRSFVAATAAHKSR